MRISAGMAFKLWPIFISICSVHVICHRCHNSQNILVILPQKLGITPFAEGGLQIPLLKLGSGGCLDVLVLTVLMEHVCREVSLVVTTADTSSSVEASCIKVSLSNFVCFCVGLRRLLASSIEVALFIFHRHVA